ncbi:TPA: type II toxin-antitoxin system HicB family antitoxin [Raoultella ornithinolytica]
MNNLMKYKGYYGSSNISFEDGVIHGKIECINDLITYEGTTVDELRSAFEEAVDDYLATCKDIGKSPDKTMSGTFNVRIGEELHKKAYLAAVAAKITLNDFVKQSLAEAVNDRKEIHYHFEKTSEVSETVSFSYSRKRTGMTSSWEIAKHGAHH